MVFNIKHTLILKEGCRKEFDILRVKMKMMSSFSEDDRYAYEMSGMFRFNRDGSISIIYHRRNDLGQFAMSFYMELLFRRISHLFENGFLKITCSSERYYKYEIREGVLNLSTGYAPEEMAGLINEIQRG